MTSAWSGIQDLPRGRYRDWHPGYLSRYSSNQVVREADEMLDVSQMAIAESRPSLTYPLQLTPYAVISKMMVS